MTNSNLHPVFQEILDSQLSIYSVSGSSSDEPESNYVCPKCGNTGRCEPRTLSDPDGQECDCGAKHTTKMSEIKLQVGTTYQLIKDWFHSKTGVSLMYDPSLISLVNEIEALGLSHVSKSLPTDECIEQWWAEGQDQKEGFWQEAPYRTNGDVIEEIKTALKYFIETWQR